MISRPFLLDQVWDSVAALHHHTQLMLLEIPTVARTRGSSFSKKSRDGSWVKRVSCGVFLVWPARVLNPALSLNRHHHWRDLLGMAIRGMEGVVRSYGYPYVSIFLHIFLQGAIWSYHMTDWLSGSSNVVLLEALTQSSSQSMWWVNPGGFSIQHKDHYMSIGSQHFAEHENGFSLEVAILRV